MAIEGCSTNKKLDRDNYVAAVGGEQRVESSR